MRKIIFMLGLLVLISGCTTTEICKTCHIDPKLLNAPEKPVWGNLKKLKS